MGRIRSLLENMQLLSTNVRYYVHKRLSSLKLDVTYEMVKVLMIISHRKCLNQQQVTDVTFKNKASVTSLIDKMNKLIE